MGVYNVVRDNAGGGPGGGGDVWSMPKKHYRPIYPKSYDIGAVSGGRAATRSAGDQYMVGLGMIGLGGRYGRGKGSGGRG